MASKRTKPTRRTAATKMKIDRGNASRAEFAAAIAIKNAFDRGRILVSLIPRLSEDLAPEALGAIGAIADDALRAQAIAAIVPRLPAALIPDALVIAANLPWVTKRDGYRAPSHVRAEALRALAPRLPEELVATAVAAAIEIPDERARARALTALIPILPDELVFPVFAAASEFSEAVRPFVVLPLVQRVAYPIHGDTLTDKIPDFAGASRMEHAAVLADIAKHLPGASSTGFYDRPANSAAKDNIDNLTTRVLLYDNPELRKKFVDLFRVHLEVEADVLHNIDQKHQLWLTVLAAEDVPETQRETLIAKFRIDIARITRPKWVGRLERGGELATLSAPNFLKRVHAEDIAADGTVHNEIIRAIDPDLMQVVELYISKRRSRAQDLGDAKGLKFILTRPSSRAVEKRAKSRLRP
jgi:hypothetical protein